MVRYASRYQPLYLKNGTVTVAITVKNGTVNKTENGKRYGTVRTRCGTVRTRYGTVRYGHGTDTVRYGTDTVRYGTDTVRYGNGDKFGRTIVIPFRT